MKSALVVLLMAINATGTVGNVFVRVTPGVEVFIDDVSAGLTTAQEQGRYVRKVPVGPHRVVVRSPDGRQATFIVNVTAGETSEVRVSPLGFRKLATPQTDDEAGALKITSLPADAKIQVNGTTRENFDATEVLVDPIPAGKHVIVMTYRGGMARGEVEVAKATTVTLEFNPKTVSFRIAEWKARPRRMFIAETYDALSHLGIPGHWRTAIRSALPSTVSIVNASAGGNAVSVTLKVPSERMGERLLDSLERSRDFERVVITSQPRREKVGWLVDFAFYFR